MRYLSITIALLAAFIFTTISVEARQVNYNDLAPLVKNFVKDHYKNKYDGDIEVKVGRIPGVPIKLPDGKFDIKINGSLRDDFVQRTTVRASFYIDGKFKRAVGIPVVLALYEDVWVATEPIYRDDSFSGSNVTVERRDISKLARTAAKSSSDLNNKKALKTFRTGDILDHKFIKKEPIVIRNSLVEVVFKSSNVAVTIPCEAMENGNIGDLIRVRNRDFKKEYRGKVIGKNYIIVHI